MIVHLFALCKNQKQDFFWRIRYAYESVDIHFVDWIILHDTTNGYDSSLPHHCPHK